eukprot:CAMPEP_0174937610 /NCGR_PEP_ID=MMETSP1355-20121228/60970_1 /TAXON_ID=464990 /ORGANISM="Hemiselmis tepida, Strain CCMP443" /LENGTH=30 /DNA_ID= /DNA_START= /DNA_END= /DNA_ORIENTATION=
MEIAEPQEMMGEETKPEIDPLPESEQGQDA